MIGWTPSSNIAYGGKAPLQDGRIPTINNRGFTTVKPDPLSIEFIGFAARCNSEVLDLGCAYGVVTLPALEAGARICACDMDARHLDIVTAHVNPIDRSRLTLECGTAPEIDFQDQRFGGILSSRVLHFLDGPAVDMTLAKMFRWLQPGGKLFLIADTPYAGVLRQYVPEYLRRKECGETWPGFIADYSPFMPRGSKSVDPLFINLFDPDVLSACCQRAGFVIERCDFMPRIAKLEDADPLGRDHVALVAVRPLS